MAKTKLMTAPEPTLKLTPDDPVDPVTASSGTPPADPSATPAPDPKPPITMSNGDVVTVKILSKDEIADRQAEDVAIRQWQKEVRHASRRVKEAQVDVDDAKNTLSEAKSVHEAAVVELTNIIDDEPGTTLFGGIGNATVGRDSKGGTVVPPGGTDATGANVDAWRSILCSVLDIPKGILGKINAKFDPDGNAATLGQVADYVSSKRGMYDIPGIGPESQKKYADAFTVWCLQNPSLCPPVGGGIKKTDAYENGYSTGISDDEPGVNPYPMGSDGDRDWQQGFDAAVADVMERRDRGDEPVEGGGVPGAAGGLGDSLLDAIADDDAHDPNDDQDGPGDDNDVE